MTKSDIKLVYAPDPVFTKKAKDVEVIDSKVHYIVDAILDIMYRNNAVGIGANMVGILKKLAVVDLQENGLRQPFVFINPKITSFSVESQIFEEGSLSYPGIKANITRPKHIELEYFDYDGNNKKLAVSGWFATVIQHELDYLDGKVFLDYLSPLKRNILLKKMLKNKQKNKASVRLYNEYKNGL